MNSTNRSEWNENVHHPLQTWEWGEFRREMGVAVDRMVIGDGNAKTYLQVGYHPLPYTPFTVGYAPRGPVITPGMIGQIVTGALNRRAFSVLLEPDVFKENQPELSDPRLQRAHRELFTRFSFVLDLKRSEDAIMSAMHPKTRYNIRLATKKGVTVSEDNSPAAFSAYLTLSRETTRRQGFYAHNDRYHRLMWQHLSPPGIARLFVARMDDEIIAAWIVFVWGKTIYYPYGASDRSHKNVMAPNLLLWEIARWAKTRQLESFDLWGALGPDPDTNDPWYGFHRFKEGYNPTLVEFTGSYDIVISPLTYRMYTVADRARWTILNALRHGRS